MMKKLNYLEDNVFIFFAEKEIVYFRKPLQEIEDDVKLDLNKNSIKHMQYQAQIEYKYHLNFAEALKLCKKILKIDKFNIDARLDLIMIILQKHINLYKHCQELINECFQIDPSYWRTYYILCVYYLYEHKPQKTLYYLQTYKYQFPENIWINIFLAQMICESSSQSDYTHSLLQSTLKQQPFDYELLLRIAYVQSALEINDEAEEVLKQGIQLNPKCSKAYNNYGYFLRTVKEDYDESIKQCLKAIQFDEENDDSYYNIGFSYGQKHEESESLKYFKLCYQKNCRYIDALEQIIFRTYNSLNDFKATIYYCNKYIQKFPTDYYGRFHCDDELDYEFLSLSQQTVLNLATLKQYEQNYEYESQTLDFFLNNEN